MNQHRSLDAALRRGRLARGAAALILFWMLEIFVLADTNTIPADKVFVGYLFRQPAKINFKLYTHLCHAFLTAEENGVVRTNSMVPSREITSRAHAAGVKVILSLGGWGWDKQFAGIVNQPAAEDRYVKTVLEMIDAYDYDGIDLDWEYPDTTEEVIGFERLARRFRAGLDQIGKTKGRSMVQTMAAAANPETLQWLKTDLLIETMDWIHVMTYDMAGEWTDYAGHHSPLFASSKQPGKPRSTELSMKYLVEHGMPANRLTVGIPLYGKGFAVSEPYASTREVRDRRLRTGGNYANLVQLQEKGWTRRWDDETKTPWLIAPDQSAVIGYDDVESVGLKTRWAMNQGFRGVFFWQIGGDLLPDGTNPLQETARKHLFVDDIQIIRHGIPVTERPSSAFVTNVIKLLESATVCSTSYAVKANTWEEIVHSDSFVHVTFGAPKRVTVMLIEGPGPRTREETTLDQILVPLPEGDLPAHFFARAGTNTISVTKYSPIALEKVAFDRAVQLESVKPYSDLKALPTE